MGDLVGHTSYLDTCTTLPETKASLQKHAVMVKIPQHLNTVKY